VSKLTGDPDRNKTAKDRAPGSRGGASAFQGGPGRNAAGPFSVTLRDFRCGEARSENREAPSSDPIHLRGCRAQASVRMVAWLPKWMLGWNLCGIGGCAAVTRLDRLEAMCSC
jgi:hypothetical protein